jgi:biopolymer transport protein TolR
VDLLPLSILDSGVSVVLPKGPHGDEDAAISKETAVVISIPSDGIYYMGRDVVSLNDMTSRIERLMEGKPIEERIVYIKGDNRVHYREVVGVVDAVRSAGIERIGLVVDPGDVGRREGGS